MIKNILLVIFLGICISISGVFTVNDNEIAVLKHGNDYSELKSGIYWHIPLYDKTTFIYTNDRIAENDYQQNIVVDKQNYIISYSTNWKVINPVQFVKYTDKNSKQELNKGIESAINLRLNEIVKGGDLLAVVNQISLLSKINIQELGIEVTNVNVVNLSNGQIKETTNMINNRLQESDFKIAQKIKESADSEYQNTLNEMQKKNNNFYQLYMKIYQLQHSDIAKESVPPLESFLTK